MTSTSIRSARLDVALGSPIAAKAHDRGGWLDLFGTDGVVVDPVGSAPHRGRAALGRFYDTFIGPRDITMSSDVDVVVGDSVFRDVTLAVGMSPTVTLDVPAILRYDLAVSATSVTIAQLRAYWELPPMIGALGRTGLRALPVATALSGAMLRNQGPLGIAGFLRGFHRPGAATVDAVRDTVERLVVGDATSLPVRHNDEIVPAADVGAVLLGARVRKVLAAGTTVAITLDHDDWAGFAFAAVDRATHTSLSIFTEPR